MIECEDGQYYEGKDVKLHIYCPLCDGPTWVLEKEKEAVCDSCGKVIKKKEKQPWGW